MNSKNLAKQRAVVHLRTELMKIVISFFERHKGRGVLKSILPEADAPLAQSS
jgi:hypothetical protein